jgi:hypothetical protein
MPEEIALSVLARPIQRLSLRRWCVVSEQDLPKVEPYPLKVTFNGHWQTDIDKIGQNHTKTLFSNGKPPGQASSMHVLGNHSSFLPFQS